MTTDLLARLRAALDETERLALAATAGGWLVGRTQGADWGGYEPKPGTTYHDDRGTWPRPMTTDGSHVCSKKTQIADLTWSRPGERLANATHIALHDPDRELRMVAAHRKILDLHRRHDEFDVCATCDSGVESCGCVGHGDWPCDTARALAEGYGITDVT